MTTQGEEPQEIRVSVVHSVEEVLASTANGIDILRKRLDELQKQPVRAYVFALLDMQGLASFAGSGDLQDCDALIHAMHDTVIPQHSGGL